MGKWVHPKKFKRFIPIRGGCGQNADQYCGLLCRKPLL